MLEGGAKLDRQPPVGHEHHSDHAMTAPPARRVAHEARHLVQCGEKCKPLITSTDAMFGSIGGCRKTSDASRARSTRSACPGPATTRRSATPVDFGNAFGPRRAACRVGVTPQIDDEPYHGAARVAAPARCRMPRTSTSPAMARMRPRDEPAALHARAITRSSATRRREAAAARREVQERARQRRLAAARGAADQHAGLADDARSWRERALGRGHRWAARPPPAARQPT